MEDRRQLSHSSPQCHLLSSSLLILLPTMYGGSRRSCRAEPTRLDSPLQADRRRANAPELCCNGAFSDSVPAA